MTFIPDPSALDSPRGRYFGPTSGWPAATAPSECDTLVLGTGPVGLTVASMIVRELPQCRLAMIDPHPRPLARFERRIDAVGQSVLRSPYEHHTAPQGGDACELVDFARAGWDRLTLGERREVRLAQAGQRSVTPLDLFLAHARHVSAAWGLARRTIRGEAKQVAPSGGGQIRIRLRDGSTIHARSVVVATGQPMRSVRAFLADGAEHDLPEGMVADAFEDPPVDGRHTIVVGGGLSAAQMAVRACRAGARVDWVCREPPRFQCNDVDARFFRTEGRQFFLDRDKQARMHVLATHLRPSVMFELRPAIERFQESGHLRLHVGHALRQVRVDDEVAVTTTTEMRLVAPRLIAALGLGPPDLGLLGSQLARYPNGYPRLRDDTLESVSHPGVFVVGAGSAMSIGPAARNIDGGRHAASRVVAGLRARGGMRVGD